MVMALKAPYAARSLRIPFTAHNFHLELLGLTLTAKKEWTAIPFLPEPNLTGNGQFNHRTSSKLELMEKGQNWERWLLLYVLEIGGGVRQCMEKFDGGLQGDRSKLLSLCLYTHSGDSFLLPFIQSSLSGEEKLVPIYAYISKPDRGGEPH